MSMQDKPPRRRLLREGLKALDLQPEQADSLQNFFAKLSEAGKKAFRVITDKMKGKANQYLIWIKLGTQRRWKTCLPAFFKEAFNCPKIFP
jgi:hypothetical protein